MGAETRLLKAICRWEDLWPSRVNIHQWVMIRLVDMTRMGHKSSPGLHTIRGMVQSERCLRDECGPPLSPVSVHETLRPPLPVPSVHKALLPLSPVSVHKALLKERAARVHVLQLLRRDVLAWWQEGREGQTVLRGGRQWFGRRGRASA